ncbi:phytanoyl-CoA dioxygenase-like protein [Phaeosphaeria sp. MPI-PUGE-AT-0046c]|nr:phytanoyl-CoA dioxygenase-like protein [Phaeosphaeria sp. MPI-PUGE-AT-0046c]
MPPRLFSTSSPPFLSEFKKLTTESTVCHYPLASSIDRNVPIYVLPDYASLSPAELFALQDEWYHIFLSGPGVFVTRELYKDISLLDRVNEVYNPQSFLEYYANPCLPLISSTWLGPHHRLTVQVNVVKPGAAAQISHRDYHIGFQGNESCAKFPKAIHVASQFLTLQGAVAQSEMPLRSGPTCLMPFSQKFEEGYMAYRIPEFQQFFLENYISLPLEKGDRLFFNPALFHAAGQNDSANMQRSENLLQISSAFGKPMEMVDTLPLIELTWESMLKKYKAEGLSDEVKAFVGNVAEGYPFPTNFNRRVPEASGMAPSSEQSVLCGGLEKSWSKEAILGELRKMRQDAAA